MTEKIAGREFQDPYEHSVNASYGQKAILLHDVVQVYHSLCVKFNARPSELLAPRVRRYHYRTALDIYNLANQELQQARSIRQLLDFPAGLTDNDKKGLLPIVGFTEHAVEDILRFEGRVGLDALHDLIMDLGETNWVQTETPRNKRAAVIVSALVGVCAAWIDSNWRLMEQVCSWCERKLPEGSTSVDYGWLKAAKIYYQLGKQREARERSDSVEERDSFRSDAENYVSTSEGKGGSESLEIEEIETLFSQDDPRSGGGLELDTSEDAERAFQCFAFFLLCAVAQSSHHSLQSENVAKWIDALIERFSSGREGISDDETNRRLARFRYILSRVRLAQDRIHEAMLEAMYALQYAPEWDLPFKESCRQQMIILEQEIATADGIRSSLNKLLEDQTRRLHGIVETEIAPVKEEILKTQAEISNAQERLKNEQENIAIELKGSQETLRKEVRDALLRVIEILGIFIAIVGVAVTSVGGIVAGRTLGEAVAIFGLGYLTTVSLFLLLRLIIWHGSRDKKSPRT